MFLQGLILFTGRKQFEYEPLEDTYSITFTDRVLKISYINMLITTYYEISEVQNCFQLYRRKRKRKQYNNVSVVIKSQCVYAMWMCSGKTLKSLWHPHIKFFFFFSTFVSTKNGTFLGAVFNFFFMSGKYDKSSS